MHFQMVRHGSRMQILGELDISRLRWMYLGGSRLEWRKNGRSRPGWRELGRQQFQVGMERACRLQAKEYDET